MADSVSLLDGSIEAGRLIASSRVADSYRLVLAASHEAPLAGFERAGDLVGRADKAMYEAKRKGGGAVVLSAGPSHDSGPAPRIWFPDP